MEETRPDPEILIADFAKSLEKWAAEGTDREQRQLLLRWLLSRCSSHGFKGPVKSSESQDSTKSADRYLIERISIDEIPIARTIERAMAGYNPDLPTSGWVRGGPIWPKAYGNIWPKAYGS